MRTEAETRAFRRLLTTRARTELRLARLRRRLEAARRRQAHALATETAVYLPVGLERAALERHVDAALARHAETGQTTARVTPRVADPPFSTVALLAERLLAAGLEEAAPEAIARALDAVVDDDADRR